MGHFIVEEQGSQISWSKGRSRGQRGHGCGWRYGEGQDEKENVICTRLLYYLSEKVIET
jgi:hypothetical protein